MKNIYSLVDISWLPIRLKDYKSEKKAKIISKILSNSKLSNLKVVKLDKNYRIVKIVK